MTASPKSDGERLMQVIQRQTQFIIESHLERRVNRILTIAFALNILAACAGNPSIKSQFRPDQASIVNVKGEYSVAGQAFLKRRDGQVVYAAGSPVALIPRSEYADEVVSIVFKGSDFQPSPPDIDNIDPRFKQMKQQAVANGEGRFALIASLQVNTIS